MNGGHSLFNALYKLFYLVWKNEYIPIEWQKSSLVQLFKGKGCVSDLDNMRFIHNKSNIAKFFGQIVISQAKDNLISNMSKYQIATKPGHRASEHLFAIKSVLALLEERKEAVIFSTWDLKKFFDSESLIDVMNELYKSNVKGKVYRLIFKLNENIKVTVKTPVGDSESKDAGMLVGQGTIEGAFISSVSIDRGVGEQFEEPKDDEKEKELKNDETV